MSRKTVDELLSEVKYDFDGYVSSEASNAFISFIKLVENGNPENKTPVVHMKILDNILSKKQDIAIMSHRGIAKSTLMEYLLWYLSIFHKFPNQNKQIDFAIYVSDSIDNGIKTMRKSIDNRYERSDFLRQYIPKLNSTDTRIEFINKAGQKFILRMYGAKTGVRGARELGQRPTLAILDDLIQKEEDARSKVVMESIENTVYSDIEDAMHPTHRKIIWLGTPFNQNDPLYKAIESGAWSPSVYPVCEKFPCKNEEFKGSWEERFTYESIMRTYTKRRRAQRLDQFYRELMLQIKSEEDRLVKNDEIIEINIGSNKNMIYYITTDFATSEKEAADFSVISVWGISNGGHKILVDGRAKRCLMDKNIIDLFNYVEKYKPMQVGIEVTGQQGGFVQWIQNQMVDKNIFFNLKEIRPNKDKLTRFKQILPDFKNKAIMYSSDIESEFKAELVNELKNVVVGGFKSKHDDVIDTISMLYQLDGIYAGLSNNNDDNVELDYLDVKYSKNKTQDNDDFFSEIKYNTLIEEKTNSSKNYV